MKKLLLLALLLSASFPIYASEFGEMATLGIALGAGLSIGLAALGGGIGQGIAIMGALEGRHQPVYERLRAGDGRERRIITQIGRAHV